MTTPPRTPADAAWQGLRDSCPDGPLLAGWNAAFDAIEATWDIVAPNPAPLDVERLARALNLTGHYPLPVNEHIHKWAAAIAREYAKELQP